MADLTRTPGQVKLLDIDFAEVYDIVPAVALSAGQAIQFNANGKAALADANAGSGAEKARGLVLGSVGIGQGVSYVLRGRVTGFDLSGLAYGALVYLSDTAGELSDTPSTTNAVPVGRVVPLSDGGTPTKVLYLDFEMVPATLDPRFFVSSEQTGTGGAQSIAHGLGVVPSVVMIFPTDLSPATVGQYVVTEGAHTNANVVVTVTTGKKYKVVAIA